MTTISLTIPEKYAQKLQTVDIADLFAQFIEEYFEYEEDCALRECITHNPRIRQLTDALA